MTMRLRKLCLKDASFMYEWMQDKNVTRGLQPKFAGMTEDDCRAFIEKSLKEDKEKHLAIVNDEDEYMGTVSLKNIDRECGEAEFAIAVRSKAMGKGFSSFAMKEILRIGLVEMGLDRIYWYVLKENQRAVRFYEKNGYQRMESLHCKQENACEEPLYFWYQVEKI